MTIDASRGEDSHADPAPETAPGTATETDPEAAPDIAGGTQGEGGLATKVSRGVGWNLITGLIVELLTLAQFLILPIFLSPADYGIYGIAAGIAFVGFMLRDFSLGMKFVQDTERDRQRAFDIAFTLELLLGIGGTIIIAAAAPLVGWAYGDSQLTWVVLAMAPFAFAGMLALPEYILIKDMRFFTRMLRQTATHVVSFAVTIWAAWAGYGVWALVIGLPVNMFMMLVTLWPVVRFWPHLVWNKADFKQYLNFGWPLWAGSLCLAGFYLGVINMLTVVFGFAIAGFFQRIWRLIEFSYRLNIRTTHAVYPAVVRIGQDLPRLRGAHIVINRLTMLVSAPIGFALIFLAPDLIRIWPSDWWAAAPFFQVVGVFFVFGTLAFDWDTYYRAAGDTKPMFLIWLYLLGFLPVILVLVWAFGEPGLWAAIVMLSLYVYLVRSYYARKLLGNVSALAAAWRQIVFAAVAGAAGWATAWALGGGLWPGIAGLAVLLAVFGAAMLVTERRLVGFFLKAARGKPTGGIKALLAD